MKRIVLCADDYGQAPAISRGIIDLLEKGRLSAASCLVTAPYWSEHAGWLKPFVNQADIGLHVNLTESKALSSAFTKAYGESLFSLPMLMARAALRQLDQVVVEAEISAQIERFSAAVGCLPRYLDGHQHVHQFPVVRDAILASYDRYLSPQQAYVRWVNPVLYPIDFIRDFKKFMICMMGTKAFGQRLKDKNIPHNTSFAGIYAFKGDYKTQFSVFLGELVDRGILMCHPASSRQSDQHADARIKEYEYLVGNQFDEDCAQFQVKIGRF